MSTHSSPSGWVWTSIGDVADIGSGLTKNDKLRQTAEKIVPLVTVGAVGIREVRPEDFGRVGLLQSDGHRGMLQLGDILVVEGNGSLAHIGRVAMWTLDLPEARHQNHLIRIRTGKQLDERYVLEWLASPSGRRLLVEQATSAAGLYNLSLSKVAKIDLPLAPLNEQRRIVAKVDALQSRSRRARQALDAIPPLLDRFRQSVLAAAFRGDLTADWRAKHPDVEPASVLLERIRAERKARWIEAEAEKARAKAEAAARAAGRPWGPADEAKVVDAARKKAERKYEEPEPVNAAAERLPELPVAWCWTRVGETFHVGVGATPSRREPAYWDGDIPWVSSGEVQFCRISSTRERITTEGLINASTEVHPPGTVLLAMIGQGRTRGQAAILDIAACNNQNAAAIRVGEAGILPEYLYRYLWLEYERTRRLGSGNQQAALNKSRVEAIRYPLAPREEVAVMVARVEHLLGAVDPMKRATDDANERMDVLEQTILATAFRGELVEQDPNDEPAWVLLERIRDEGGALHRTM